MRKRTASNSLCLDSVECGSRSVLNLRLNEMCAVVFVRIVFYFRLLFVSVFVVVGAAILCVLVRSNGFKCNFPCSKCICCVSSYVKRLNAIGMSWH